MKLLLLLMFTPVGIVISYRRLMRYRHKSGRWASITRTLDVIAIVFGCFVLFIFIWFRI